MSEFQESISALFQHAWQRRANPMPTQVAQAITKLAASLLFPASPPVQHGSAYTLVSFEKLHRYVLVIHCPDQAFYPDAVRSYLRKQGIEPIEQQSVLYARSEGESVAIVQAQDEDNALLLVLQLPAATVQNMDEVHRDIGYVLAGVEKSVGDFSAVCDDLAHIQSRLAEDEPVAADLLQWMLNNHFVLFGLAYPMQPKRNKGIVENKRLFVRLMPDAAHIFDLPAKLQPGKPGMRWLHLPQLFHHLYSEENLEVVQLSWRENGGLHTAHVLGYFSRSARHTNASTLPMFKDMWQSLVAEPSLQRSAFYRREIHMLFDRSPKAVLSAVPIGQWLEPFKAIVDMSGSTQAVTARLDSSLGGLSYLLIAVDKQRFGSNVWANMQRQLLALGLNIWGDEHFEVGGKHLILLAVSATAWPAMGGIQQAVRQCVIFWKDLAQFALLQEHLELPLLHRALDQINHISALYENQFSPEHFVCDVKIRELIKQDGCTRVHVHLLHQQDQNTVEIHVYTSQDIPLGVMTDKLNAFALVAMEQTLVPFHDDDCRLFISRFRCLAPAQLHIEGLTRLEQGIEDVLNARADHDRLNALLVLCGLNIHDVLVLISLRNHLIQLSPEMSKTALSDSMLKYIDVSRALFQMFEAKHRPAMPTSYAHQAKANFDAAMLAVNSLNEDTGLRALAAIVDASLRCNAWVRKTNEALAMKVDTSLLDFAPYPKPYREIFVHGVFVEGVHLRAGPVARGGLRYSDRPTDFRTEVLELMATQVVKNGQIVPTGAKGGFVVRDGAGADFVLAQYHQFVRALLALTDDRQGSTNIPPVGIEVPTSDANDSYLVVAADKGTARYSDDANAESLAAHFWLGDAFASGGSQGYDHKAFGITARGAWVATAHHFARQGIDLWSAPVRVVGIGDMGGDVFGNGLLLNPNVQLLAAFNHQHIFLDPNPDVAAAFAERQRLFTEVAGWGHYRLSLISEGGGVFERSAKSIPLSQAVQEVLDIHEATLSGEALIRAIMQAPVDLLYNGGIGTYIKASTQTHADAQDPGNNAVRVDAAQLRCKAICEGGNLGLTQAARVEFAQAGGMINTDAIDNAAGVNMSDHEVNLKILLAHLPNAQRNRWLKKAAQAVADQCLADNKAQAIALSIAEITASQRMPRLLHLQQTLFEDGRLNALITDSASLALRPVLAGWLGHEKNRVHAALDAEQFRSKMVFGDIFLRRYFPEVLHKKFATPIEKHPLADDIAHTRITSYVLNRYGITCIDYLQNIGHATVSEAIQAMLMGDTILGTGQVYEQHFSGVDADMNVWYALQQDVLTFAEELLAMHACLLRDAQWLAATTQAWAKFAKDNHKLPPALVALAPAIPMSEQMGLPLCVCLQATEACLQALPFLDLEAGLRTPLWSGELADGLRRQWLHRLAQLKLAAGKRLVSGTTSQAKQRLAAWRAHPLQHDIKTLLESEAASEASDIMVGNLEGQRLRQLLAMTHLQTIVAADDSPPTNIC